MSDDASVERPHAHPELAAGDALDSVPDRTEGGPMPGSPGGRNLLGIGLAIYFVVLIGIVVVMLLLAWLMPPG